MSLVDDVRAGRAADAVDDVVPHQVVEPATAEETAAALADASGRRLSTVMRGGGTKIGWGRVPQAIDLLVSMRALNRLVAHRHADLTATVQAGVTLSHLNAELARHGQWLPLTSAFDDATIGGLVATNDAGPLRHRNGTPRDLLIGCTLALTDGRVATSGGHVVKNVAGYDLGRFVCGSHGSFAAIVDATFKLLPLPQTTATIILSCRDGAAAGAAAAALGSSQLDPSACDIRAGWADQAGRGCQLLVRFSSSPGAVEAQVSAARALVGGDRITGGAEAALWDDQVRRPWMTAGAVVRLSWLPAALPRVLALLSEVEHRVGATMALTGRVAVGAGHVSIDAPAAAQAQAVADLRASASVGHVVVLRASRELKQAVDVWGPPPSAAVVLTSLKRMFDRNGILNAARGPV